MARSAAAMLMAPAMVLIACGATNHAEGLAQRLPRAFRQRDLVDARRSAGCPSAGCETLARADHAA